LCLPPRRLRRPGCEADKANLLTRSIYLPVEIKLCEHLRDAVLYQDDQAVSLLPAKRIFQFTYYPGLSRIEPLRTDLRVEGHRADGSDFVGRLAVTPWGVFTANHKVELDMDKQLEKMRFKLDVRYKPVMLKMRCIARREQTASSSVGHGSPSSSDVAESNHRVSTPPIRRCPAVHAPPEPVERFLREVDDCRGRSAIASAWPKP
jgi:hypothetical protein